jgi:hypothetical protein
METTQPEQEAPVTPQSPHLPQRAGAPPATGQLIDARRPRLSWLRTLPLLVRPMTRTMPWATLITGCLAGTVFLAVLAFVVSTPRQPLGQGDVRIAFLPAVAALAFVLRAPFRPLTQTTPVPAWVAPAGHLVLAAPVLAATCWAQLRIMAHTLPPHILGHPPAVYPLIAQLTGWCAIAVAVAVCADRTRFADLGGAIAAPVSFVAIALAWYAPVGPRFLVEPPASADRVTVAWYLVVATALVLACMAMQDHWHRYARKLHRSARERGR